MQGENRRTWKKTCGSKYGLETKCTYIAGTRDRTRSQWCTGKIRSATPSHGHLLLFISPSFKSNSVRGQDYMSSVITIWEDEKKWTSIKTLRRDVATLLVRVPPAWKPPRPPDVVGCKGISVIRLRGLCHPYHWYRFCSRFLIWVHCIMKIFNNRPTLLVVLFHRGFPGDEDGEAFRQVNLKMRMVLKPHRWLWNPSPDTHKEVIKHYNYIGVVM